MGDLAGKTIDQVILRLNHLHSWYYTGMYLIIGYAWFASLPGSWNGLGTTVHLPAVDEPGLVTTFDQGSVTTFDLTGTVRGAELQNGGANAVTLGYNGQPAWNLWKYGYVCGAGGSNACNALFTVNWHTGATLTPGRQRGRRPDPDHLRQLPGAARGDRPGRGHRLGRQHLRGRVHRRCPGLPPGRHPGRGRDLAGPRRAVRLAGLRPGPDAPRGTTWPSRHVHHAPGPGRRAGHHRLLRLAGRVLPGDPQTLALQGTDNPAVAAPRPSVFGGPGGAVTACNVGTGTTATGCHAPLFRRVAAGQRLRRCRSTRDRPSASCSARSAAADRPYRRAMAGPLQPARYTRLSVWPPFSR